MRNPTTGALALVILLSAAAGPAFAQSERAKRCEAGKLLAVGQYNLCRAQADAKAVRKDTPPSYERCDARLGKQWTKLEKKAQGECPTSGDVELLQLQALRHSGRVTAALDGVGSGTCSPASLPFAYSYMVTNRADPFSTTRASIVPATGAALEYFTADGPYVAANVTTAYTKVTKAVFVERLKADLAHATAGGAARLGLYIHGLGNTFSDALAETATYGCDLATDGAYPGLVIGFSWPSYGLLDSAGFYGSADTGPPIPPLTPQLSGSIRDNVLGSRESFAALLTMLQDDVIAGANPAVELSLMTHSEGNYMLMTGMAAVTDAPEVAHCLMLAADISAVSLQSGEQGENVAKICGDVTVYFSGADEELSSSNYEFFQYHRQDYPTRLGIVGPYPHFPAPTELPANVIGLDCSRVTVYPAVDSILDVHSSYRFVPIILADQTQTMLGEAHTKRSPWPGSANSYVLGP